MPLTRRLLRIQQTLDFLEQNEIEKENRKNQRAQRQELSWNQKEAKNVYSSLPLYCWHWNVYKNACDSGYVFVKSNIQPNNVDGVLPVEEEQTTRHTAHLGNKKDLQSTSDDSSISPVDTTLHLPGSPRAHPPDDPIPHSPEISKSHQTDCLKSSKASIAHSVNSNRRQPDLNVSNNANFSKAAESHSQTQTNAAEALRKSVSGPAKRPLLARPLRGTRVVARNNKDGLYYLGTVLKCPNVRQATVQFSDGCQKVLTRFILPLSGAVTCPPLSVGDYVLVQVVNLERNSDCFVPGIIHSPPKTRRVQLQFHTVMLYNGQEVTTLRLYLVKISKERFEFTVRYTAAMEGKTRKKVDVPAAKGKKRQRRKYIENHRRYSHSSESSHSDTSTHSKSDTGSPSSSKSSSPAVSPRPRSPTPGIGRRPLSSSPARSPDAGQETHNDTPVFDRRSELQRLKQQLEKQQEQRRKQRKKLQKMKKKIRQMKLELPSKTERGIQTSSDEQEKEVIITPPILQLRRSLPKLQPAEEVLARFTDDGWYYRGSVQQDLGDLSYIVEDATGFIERIWREDIISDYDDKAPVLKEQDKVIAQHPLYSNSYGPGCVLSVDEVLQTAVIKFYDGHESTIPRVEVYHLPAAIKYNHDVLHIQECQQSMLGLSVIARDDSNGEYYPGQITALEKGGQQYVIRWSDGSKSKQLPVHIFSAKTRRQRLLIGDRILALADPDQVVFLPGQITGAHAWGLIVRFCDGQVRDDVSALFCYWLTQGYFEEASYFWNLNHPDFGRKP